MARDTFSSNRKMYLSITIPSITQQLPSGCKICSMTKLMIGGIFTYMTVVSTCTVGQFVL